MYARVVEWTVHRVEAGNRFERTDLLAIEEPLEILVGYMSNDSPHIDRLAITMRTPGFDEELALGFLYAEGIVSDLGDIASVHEGRSMWRGKPTSKTITITLAEDVDYTPERHLRRFVMTSSCGVCGRAALPLNAGPPVSAETFTPIAPSIISTLPMLQRKSQAVFQHTGGLHAASLFDSTGRLIKTFEDVGRHNAMDKLVGYGLQHKLLPFSDEILFFSGRVSYELMQKAIAAGINIVGAVGAPSSQAVHMAYLNNITLLGFVRDATFNAYSTPERILDPQQTR